VSPKLLLDEHLSPTIGHRLTHLLFDVTSVRDRGLAGLEDWELMDWCAGEGRAICTQNEEDFRTEHGRRLARGEDHFGIIVVRATWSVEQTFQLLLDFLQHIEDVDLLNQLVALDGP
jgi:predicted nuclease of predicted toxin-antitoxin system